MLKPRIGGHPVHIMLVHFPSALYPMSVVCSSLFYYNANAVFGQVSFFTLAAGAGMGWLAMLFGLWESFFVPSAKTKIVTTIFWHATLNGIVTILFTILAVKDWNLYPEIRKDSTLLLIVKWIGIIALLAGNYFGGKLVLKYHLGVEKTSADEGQSKLFNHLD
jgi:uncharacterized membrane protein